MNRTSDAKQNLVLLSRLSKNAARNSAMNGALRQPACTVAPEDFAHLLRYHSLPEHPAWLTFEDEVGGLNDPHLGVLGIAFRLRNSPIFHDALRKDLLFVLTSTGKQRPFDWNFKKPQRRWRSIPLLDPSGQIWLSAREDHPIPVYDSVFDWLEVEYLLPFEQMSHTVTIFELVGSDLADFAGADAASWANFPGVRAWLGHQSAIVERSLVSQGSRPSDPPSPFRSTEFLTSDTDLAARVILWALKSNLPVRWWGPEARPTRSQRKVAEFRYYDALDGVRVEFDVGIWGDPGDYLISHI